jgi:mRNA-degrading endonuclease toxin of MazEF toxin-antitoxin module
VDMTGSRVRRGWCRQEHAVDDDQVNGPHAAAGPALCCVLSRDAGSWRSRPVRLTPHVHSRRGRALARALETRNGTLQCANVVKTSSPFQCCQLNSTKQAQLTKRTNPGRQRDEDLVPHPVLSAAYYS